MFLKKWSRGKPELSYHAFQSALYLRVFLKGHIHSVSCDLPVAPREVELGFFSLTADSGMQCFAQDHRTISLSVILQPSAPMPYCIYRASYPEDVLWREKVGIQETQMSVLSEARLLTWYAGKVPCVLVAERARLLSLSDVSSLRPVHSRPLCPCISQARILSGLCFLLLWLNSKSQLRWDLFLGRLD